LLDGGIVNERDVTAAGGVSSFSGAGVTKSERNALRTKAISTSLKNLRFAREQKSALRIAPVRAGGKWQNER
jgi:hypothetical protein